MAAIGIDTHNIVSSEEMASIVKKTAQALFENPRNARDLPAIMFRGAPGVGKSTIVRSVAQELGIGFIDVRLAQMERVDFAGLPSVKNGVTEWNIPSFWPQDPNSRGIILLDEITSAPSDVQVAAYSVVLDRQIPNSNYKIPDGWLIVAAGNRACDKAVVKTMSSALANRFMHFDVDANAEDWCKWGVQHDIDPAVIGFIRYRPMNLFRTEKQNLEQGWPSPRSWERVSNSLKVFKDNEELLQKVVYGLVGTAVGCEFMAFYKVNAKFDDVLAMMTQPDSSIVVPEKDDQKYALASAATYLLWRGQDEADEQARINGFFRICMKMGDDFCAMMAKSAMMGNSQVKPMDAARKMLTHKMYKEVAAKCKAAMAAPAAL